MVSTCAQVCVRAGLAGGPSGPSLCGRGALQLGHAGSILVCPGLAVLYQCARCILTYTVRCISALGLKVGDGFRVLGF